MIHSLVEEYYIEFYAFWEQKVLEVKCLAMQDCRFTPHAVLKSLLPLIDAPSPGSLGS